MNRIIGFVWVVMAIALLVYASGCGPTLTAQTSPPAGRTASFDENDGHYDLDISQGVAIAISCYNDGPCKDVVVATENESIADVKSASLIDTVSLVIVGKAPGVTRVKVRTSKGDKTINVKVLAPPASAGPSKVAL